MVYLGPLNNGDWPCAYCGSLNPTTAYRCPTCGGPRPVTEHRQHFAPPVEYNLELDPAYAAAFANTFYGKKLELDLRIKELQFAIGEALLPIFRRKADA